MLSKINTVGSVTTLKLFWIMLVTIRGIKKKAKNGSFCWVRFSRVRTPGKLHFSTETLCTPSIFLPYVAATLTINTYLRKHRKKQCEPPSLLPPLLKPDKRTSQLSAPAFTQVSPAGPTSTCGRSRAGGAAEPARKRRTPGADTPGPHATRPPYPRNKCAPCRLTRMRVRGEHCKKQTGKGQPGNCLSFDTQTVTPKSECPRMTVNSNTA